MAEADLDLVFQIQQVYLKDVSLQQPNSPEILLSDEEPSVSIELGVEATPMPDDLYEVRVMATVHTKAGDDTLFLLEAKQAGIFEIRNVSAEDLDAMLEVTCPQIVYPYLRANVADVIQRAGFMPVNLTEINFMAMYQERAKNDPHDGDEASPQPEHHADEAAIEEEAPHRADQQSTSDEPQSS